MDTKRLSRFFDALSPRLDMAREVDEKLNAALARRFNVLDYLRTSEMGLSRVIADLLDPRATHGQRALFLDTFLRGLQRSSAEQGRLLNLTHGFGYWTVAEESVKVKVERTIRGGRLDISVEFEGSDKQLRCLAIENKPYAGDQDKQIHRYLGFLEETYGDRQPTNHLLIYLSRTGGLPSEKSVTKARLDKEVTERDFAVMGYWMEGALESSEGEEDSQESRLLLKYSLADWFAACRKQCDVDRLRSFLRDAETFCERHFGGADMPETQLETAIAFIRRDRNHAQVAQLVAQAVPELRNRILRDVWTHVNRAVRKFCNGSEWRPEEHRGGRQNALHRLRLYKNKKNHWSKTAFSGVWFMRHRGTFGVGIEWPQEGVVNLVERVRQCFNDMEVDAGRQEKGGGEADKPDTWWFVGYPKGEDWRWERLLDRSDEELRGYVDTVVALMKALTRVIDDAEEPTAS